MVDTPARAWHAVTALVSGSALLLQLVLSTGLAGEPLAVRWLRFLSFFTIQSNLLVCVTTARLALHGDVEPRGWRVARLCGVMGITVTGLVYVTVLRGVNDIEGWWVVADAMLHYATPLLAVAGWLAFGPRGRVDRGVVGRALLWPVAWLGYTLVHGAVSRWYPYPFLDVDEIGYGSTLLNCAVVTLLMVGVASGLLALDRRLPARGRTGRAATMHG